VTGEVTGETTPGGAPYVLPKELLIDTDVARQIIGEFLRGHLEQTGFERMVLGLSGGLDSALVAFLISEAIGADNLLCVLLPYRTSSLASTTDAEAVVAALGCPSRLVEITPMVDGYFPVEPEDDVDASEARRRGNFAARMRMSVLYDLSVVWTGLVCGTGNKTEALLGYTTIYGDNASALAPIGDLYKSQVRQLAAEMGVPQQVLFKAPSADLWPNQTDEGELGMTYADMDRLLFWMIDRRRTDEQLVEIGFSPATIRRVQQLVASSEYKRQMPPVAKLTTRTPGVDYLYPRRRPGPTA
jgi:NAD+ synthase